ncbi:hypothetical protein LSH36_496g01025 [Paralvinella palmiformis]|uniref:Catenin alpha n=1 Tax=Paralvinella palmiformis TaxID=53620 RepID=A0AAD9J8A6_9ANNE|nr:hypothetical protein LSH36_496g01025 [Paralvinella palmiformis]
MYKFLGYHDPYINIKVTTLVSQKGPSKKKKGRSKKAHVLSAAVQKATEHFIHQGEEIGNENPEIRNEMLAAVEDVKKTGEQMGLTSSEFADDPCSSMKRGAMVRAARALLTAVTRLLIIADMVDVHLLLKSLRIVEDDLDRIRNASSQQELMDSFRNFGRSVVELTDRAGRRQLDLKDARHRDDLAAARATLKKNSMMLLTTSKAYVRHPELAAARANRDYVLKQVSDAVNTISGVAQATGSSEAHPYEGAGELAAALDEFDQKIIMDPASFKEMHTRPSLEERLESIIHGAALMADASCTRDERREKIISECNSVRQALQDLLTEYISNDALSTYDLRLVGAFPVLYHAGCLAHHRTRCFGGHGGSLTLPAVSVKLSILIALRAFSEMYLWASSGELHYRVLLFNSVPVLSVEFCRMPPFSMQPKPLPAPAASSVGLAVETIFPRLLTYVTLFKKTWSTSFVGQRGPSEQLGQALEQMSKKTQSLRKQLRKAVMDHVSDSFLETNMPLLVLINTAKAGDERNVEEHAKVFQEHANKLVEVANLACSMSNNEEGVKMVRMAAAQIESLCPQVINAARILAARPRSKVALENMDVFKDAWEKQVRLLTEAVDDITTIEDFLAVSESHIYEDVNKCVLALHEKDPDMLDRTAGAIRGRCARVCSVVTAEMDNYEPGPYTERVMEAVYMLRDQVVPHFARHVDGAVDCLTARPPQEADEVEFVDASQRVYDGVRDVRRAVLLIRSPDEIDTDSEIDCHDDYEGSRASEYTYASHVTDQEDVAYELRSDRDKMRCLPEEERKKIQQQVHEFRMEKARLDREMAKWDDSGNDIIVLSKQMCMIMMEMTDFTRGRGPLKTTMDVINAAKKISEAGSKLDKLCRQIVDQCPDSASKSDLLAYLERISLYCHQLNITSKVKADVQNISGELIVSGSLVTWKMKAPEKKPLVHKENRDELGAKVRKGTKMKGIEPIKALSEFHESFA